MCSLTRLFFLTGTLYSLKLQGSRFDLELRLRSVWSTICSRHDVLLPVSLKNMSVSETAMLIYPQVWMSVCMVSCDRLASHRERVPSIVPEIYNFIYKTCTRGWEKAAYFCLLTNESCVHLRTAVFPSWGAECRCYVKRGGKERSEGRIEDGEGVWGNEVKAEQRFC